MSTYVYGGPDGRKFQSGETYDYGNGYKYRYDFSDRVFITTYLENNRKVHRLVLTGKFSYSNGTQAGPINRVSYFSYVISGANQGDEDGWSLNMPNIQFKDYPAFGVQENATSANFFYSNDGHVYKGAKFSSLSTISDRSQLGGLPDTQCAKNEWWETPFKTFTSPTQSPLKGIANKADVYALTDTPEFGAGTADRIINFNPMEKDKLQIGLSQFGADAAGTFKVAKDHKALTKALASSTDFIYLKSTGELYYNENGKLPGCGAGGIFAILENKANITAKNVEFL